MSNLAEDTNVISSGANWPTIPPSESLFPQPEDDQGISADDEPALIVPEPGAAEPAAPASSDYRWAPPPPTEPSVQALPEAAEPALQALAEAAEPEAAPAAVPTSMSESEAVSASVPGEAPLAEAVSPFAPPVEPVSALHRRPSQFQLLHHRPNRFQPSHHRSNRWPPWPKTQRNRQRSWMLQALNWRRKHFPKPMRSRPKRPSRARKQIGILSPTQRLPAPPTKNRRACARAIIPARSDRPNRLVDLTITHRSNRRP